MQKEEKYCVSDLPKKFIIVEFQTIVSYKKKVALYEAEKGNEVCTELCKYWTLQKIINSIYAKIIKWSWWNIVNPTWKCTQWIWLTVWKVLPCFPCFLVSGWFPNISLHMLQPLKNLHELLASKSVHLQRKLAILQRYTDFLAQTVF